MPSLSHSDYERLERAVARGSRISLFRRGNEYVVVPVALETRSGKEMVHARHPATGELMAINVDEIDTFEVIG